MSSRLKKLVLLLAIAVLPLQGIAGALSVLMCHGEAQSHATHDAQHGDDHGVSPQGEHHDDAGSGSDPSLHPCCHLTASGLPGMASVPPMPDFAVLATAPLLLHDLFVPDRPQRPPLA